LGNVTNAHGGFDDGTAFGMARGGFDIPLIDQRCAAMDGDFAVFLDGVDIEPHPFFPARGENLDIFGMERAGAGARIDPRLDGRQMQLWHAAPLFFADNHFLGDEHAGLGLAGVGALVAYGGVSSNTNCVGAQAFLAQL